MFSIAYIYSNIDINTARLRELYNFKLGTGRVPLTNMSGNAQSPWTDQLELFIIPSNFFMLWNFYTLIHLISSDTLCFWGRALSCEAIWLNGGFIIPFGDLTWVAAMPLVLYMHIVSAIVILQSKFLGSKNKIIIITSQFCLLVFSKKIYR